MSSQSIQNNLMEVSKEIRVRSKTQLPADFVPSDFDVVCAKGREAFNHPGNQRFRITIANHLQRYSQAKSKLQKSSLVDEIVDMVRKESGDVGGFVRQDTRTGLWYEIGDHHAREKVGHGFREALIKQNPEKKEKRRKMRARNKARRQENKQQQQQQEQQLQDIEPIRLEHLGAPSQSSLLDDDDDDEQEQDLTPLPLSSVPAISASPAELLSALPDDIVVGMMMSSTSAMTTAPPPLVARSSKDLEFMMAPPPPPSLVSQSSKDLDLLLDFDSSDLAEAMDLHDMQEASQFVPSLSNTSNNLACAA